MYKVRSVMEKRSKQYVINLAPQAWRRAGIYNKRFFDTQTRDKLAFGLYMKQQQGDDPLFSTAIEAELIFFMPWPKDKRKHAKTVWHKTVPDLDNLEKFILDMCKSIAITDDRIVARVVKEKKYDEHPRVVITFTELE